MRGTLGQVRFGVCLLLVLIAASAASASALADGTTTDATTTTTPTTTATTTTPSYAALAPGTLPSSSCVGAGAILIAERGRAPVALDSPAVSLSASAYPSDASIAAFESASGAGSACRTGRISLDSVSLFGGAITATSVTATAGRGTVSGLEADGSPLTLARGDTTYVNGWARVTVGGSIGRLSAPLIVQLDRSRGTLPAGTVLLVGFAEAPVVKPAAKKPEGSTAATARSASGKRRTHARRAGRTAARHKKHVAQPLKATPKLGRIHYVFPVDGGASYVDTYGAGRSDIYDGWHHGDDLFAPLGTPVVAVARGTLSLVGWNEVGGWRLWLTDKDGNSFYYAHLSGYSRWILHHRHVRAGQVLGFLGRTGDAFTTEPHLHFEVHPRQLLKLGYDGAVDPTTYLHGWRVAHVPARLIPRPARMRAPLGTPAQEAAVVWHELLVARHLVPKRSEAGGATAVEIRRSRPVEPSPAHAVGPLYVVGAEPVSAHVAATREGPWPTAVGAAALAIGGFVLFAVGRRRRWSDQPPSSAPDAN